jgi:hypothetical protein
MEAHLAKKLRRRPRRRAASSSHGNDFVVYWQQHTGPPAGVAPAQHRVDEDFSGGALDGDRDVIQPELLSAMVARRLDQWWWTGS